MISLDQVLLLEQKIESAVAKIQQLQAENDALRRKCAELTNSLSTTSEQLSSYETDQNQIESGILKALDRLNSIENSVLKAAGQAASIQNQNINVQPVAQVAPAQNVHNVQQKQPVQASTPIQSQPAALVQQTPKLQNIQPQQPQNSNISEYNQLLESSPIVQQNNFKPEPVSFDSLQDAPAPVSENNSDNLKFDIF